MKRLFTITMVGLLLFAGSVQGVSAAKVCSTQSISCVSATEPSYRGMGDLATTEAAASAMVRRRAAEAETARYTGLAEHFAERAAAAAMARQRAAAADAARYTGLAAYFAERAAWGPRADAARYQALADYYAALTWDATTLARTRGVAGLYSR